MSVMVNCSSSSYCPMSDTTEYSVIMTEYLAGGGDGYSVIKNNMRRQLQGPLDTDILKDYLKIVSPVSTDVEERINLVTVHHLDGGHLSGAVTMSFPTLVTTAVIILKITTEYFG